MHSVTICQCTSTREKKDSVSHESCTKTGSFKSKYPATLKYSVQYKSQDRRFSIFLELTMKKMTATGDTVKFMPSIWLPYVPMKN